MGAYLNVRAFARSLLPVLVGGVIYVCWRGDGLRLHGWIDAVGAASLGSAFRSTLSAAVPAPPPWVAYNLPDGLWLLGAAAFMRAIWRNSRRTERWFWLSLPVLLAFGSEAAQGLGWLEGTFDPKDLLAYTAAAAAAYLPLGRWRGRTLSPEAQPG